MKIRNFKKIGNSGQNVELANSRVTPWSATATPPASRRLARGSATTALAQPRLQPEQNDYR